MGVKSANLLMLTVKVFSVFKFSDLMNSNVFLKIFALNSNSYFVPYDLPYFTVYFTNSISSADKLLL